MKYTNTVFHDLLRTIPKSKFQKTVERYKGDHRVRTCHCWTQFVALLYAQLNGCKSLRNLEMVFNSHSNHHYHLGVEAIKRSTLSDANKNRPVGIYKELFHFMLSQARESTAKDAGTAIRLIDSTTIDLNKSIT